MKYDIDDSTLAIMQNIVDKGGTVEEALQHVVGRQDLFKLTCDVEAALYGIQCVKSVKVQHLHPCNNTSYIDIVACGRNYSIAITEKPSL